MKIHYQDDALCIATSGNMFINVWDGVVTVPRLRKLRDVELEFAAASVDGICVLTIIHRPGNMMSLGAEERAAADDVTTAVNAFVRARAFVVVGSGFWGGDGADDDRGRELGGAVEISLEDHGQRRRSGAFSRRPGQAPRRRTRHGSAGDA